MLLERLQADFAASLRDECAPVLLAALDAGNVPCTHGLALYRSNVHAAREKALASAYPVVRALVGAEFFASLAREYGCACPSASGDLNAFGLQFADFVRTYEHAQSLPYLGDVAELEWLVHRAHRAADTPMLARERMAVISPYDLLAARFALHPACAWMRSRFPVTAIWCAHQPGADVMLPDSLDRAECALVTRPRWRAEVIESSAAEIAALAELRGGGDMDAAIGAALALDAQFDFAKALLRWLDAGVLVGMDPA